MHNAMRMTMATRESVAQTENLIGALLREETDRLRSLLPAPPLVWALLVGLWTMKRQLQLESWTSLTLTLWGSRGVGQGAISQLPVIVCVCGPHRPGL